MDSLDMTDIFIGGVAGAIGFTLAFYLMRLELEDSLKVGGISATAFMGAKVVVQKIHEGGGWSIPL